jgi:hypothetical protein
VATGMNKMVRTVCSRHRDRARVQIAFAASAVALAIGVGVAFTVPRRRAVVLEPASELAPG